MASACGLVMSIIRVLDEDAILFQETAEYLRAAKFKTFFLHEGPLRCQFALELRSELDFAKNVSGMVVSSANRSPSSRCIRDNILDDDKTLLVAAEHAEEAVKRIYSEAIAGAQCSTSIHRILSLQGRHIVESHIQLKDYVDSLSW